MKKLFNFRLLVLIGVLIMSINTAWAERWVESCNINYKTDNGTGSTHSGWYNNDGIYIDKNDVTLEFGTLTEFILYDTWAKAKHSDNWGTNGNQMKYGFSADSESEYNLNWGWQKDDNPKHYDFPIPDYDAISNAPNNPGQNTLHIYYNLNYNASDMRKSYYLYINFTIPGFRGAPASKAFGTIPVNKEAETTISFNHYGNALEAGDFVITGSTDFTVRSFSESGVNIVFAPTTTGSKSATLTITDDYDNTCTISLTGTAAAAGTVGTVTTLYFNDYRYDGAGDWAAASAKYRFVCAYTDGVYTHYNMTKCPNTEHTYTADVEIKAGKSVSIDRYNPSSPYEMWNSVTPSDPGLSSTNPYAKSTDIQGAYATNHPINDVGNRKIYYDNSASGFTNTLCVLIGRDKQVSDDGSSTYSKAYTMSPVTNTKLYYCAETAGTDNWHDVTYYAVIGTSSDASTISGWSSSTNWGSSTISTKGNKGYTAAYTSLFGLIDGNVYLASSSSYSGGAMTINKRASTAASGLNSNQTIKYSVSFDGSDTYAELSSGGRITPAQIQISAYKFVDGTYNSVSNTSNSQTISAGQNSTVSAYVPAAYTGATSLSYTSVNEYFDWIGWYDAANGGSTVSSPYYPKSAGTVYARLRAKKYTVTYDANEGSCDTEDAEATAFTSVTLPTPSRDGYIFDGWYDDDTKIGDAGDSYTPTADITLTAHWTEDLHEVTLGNDGHGHVEIGGEIETSVSGVGIATASSAITAVPANGYTFANWTLPTGVTAADTYNEESNPISINATDDDLTITANFTANTYAITLNKGDHGAANKSASVVFDATSLTSITHVVADAGYQLDGYYDGELKVLNADGSFAGTNVSGYVTSDKWSKYADATLTAKFTTVTLYFNVEENAYWSNAAKWTPNCVPTIEHDVVLQKTAQVDVNTAQAKSVRIHHYGDFTGKLVIKEKAGLLVAEDIKAKHAADKAYEATTDEDLQIRTSDEGNGGLITGNACAGNEAEYVFYAKACKYIWSEHAYYINQYVGIPFASMEAYELYGFNIFVYDDSEDDWRTPGSASMTPWTTYNMISRYTDNWPYYFIDGVLNLPGKSGTVELVCGSRYSEGTGTADKDNEYFDNGGDHMFANSWTAPISIGAFTASDFSDLDKDGKADIAQTIYIFNAGFEGAGEGKDLGSYAGTWSSFPISSSTYMARAVIPATQAFLVSSKFANATMTLDYEKHVYNPAKARDSICTYPTRAPRRTKMNDDPNVLRIIVSGNDVEADQLYVLERGDFSFGYDDSWDGNKISSLSFVPQIYAVNGEHKMAVNAIPDMEGMKIGFKAGKNANEYTFSFEYADDAETLYLYDTDTQAYTQITNEATYSFTTSDTKEHERFVITRKAPQIVTGIEETIIKTNARKQMIDGTLYIIRDGRMYNAEGALVK